MSNVIEITLSDNEVEGLVKKYGYLDELPDSVKVRCAVYAAILKFLNKESFEE